MCVTGRKGQVSCTIASCDRPGKGGRAARGCSSAASGAVSRTWRWLCRVCYATCPLRAQLAHESGRAHQDRKALAAGGAWAAGQLLARALLGVWQPLSAGAAAWAVAWAAAQQQAGSPGPAATGGQRQAPLLAAGRRRLLLQARGVLRCVGSPPAAPQPGERQERKRQAFWFGGKRRRTCSLAVLCHSLQIAHATPAR